MTNAITINHIANHFESWADAGSSKGGFVSWAWDAREGILDALKSGDVGQLADDIAYSVNSELAQDEDFDGEHVELSTALEFIEAYKSELIEALVESLEEN